MKELVLYGQLVKHTVTSSKFNVYVNKILMGDMLLGMSFGGEIGILHRVRVTVHYKRANKKNLQGSC